MILRTIIQFFGALLWLACLPSTAAGAESERKLSVLPNQIAVGVVPPVAAPGVARKIVVAGLWPTACVPTGAELAEGSDFGRPTLGILVNEPQTFVACAAALTSYRIELDYTPRSPGQVPIVAITTATKISAKATLVTSSDAAPRALYDVSGAWYDPQTTGSGLMIAHDYGRSDSLFATWQIYDAASGVSRWYSIQQGVWNADGLSWEGLVFETMADARPCDTLCASPISHAVFRGVARLTFSASFVHGNLDAALDFNPAQGAPRRASNLQRVVPNLVVLQ
jgi:hypothetical protein